MLEQLQRSQRQWINTFDSILDLILVHDADCRILKTNQALLQRMDKAPPMFWASDVMKCCRKTVPGSSARIASAGQD